MVYVTRSYSTYSAGARRIGTLNWVDFFNTERPHEAIDDLTPMVAEELHYAASNEPQLTG